MLETCHPSSICHLLVASAHVCLPFDVRSFGSTQKMSATHSIRFRWLWLFCAVLCGIGGGAVVVAVVVGCGGGGGACGGGGGRSLAVVVLGRGV